MLSPSSHLSQSLTISLQHIFSPYLRRRHLDFLRTVLLKYLPVVDTLTPQPYTISLSQGVNNTRINPSFKGLMKLVLGILCGLCTCHHSPYLQHSVKISPVTHVCAQMLCMSFSTLTLPYGPSSGAHHMPLVLAVVLLDNTSRRTVVVSQQPLVPLTSFP